MLVEGVLGAEASTSPSSWHENFLLFSVTVLPESSRFYHARRGVAGIQWQGYTIPVSPQGNSLTLRLRVGAQSTSKKPPPPNPSPRHRTRIRDRLAPTVASKSSLRWRRSAAFVLLNVARKRRLTSHLGPPTAGCRVSTFLL
jgi:hypothetical protein